MATSNPVVEQAQIVPTPPAAPQAGLYHDGLFHQWATPPLLTGDSAVTLTMSVNNLVIGNMRIIVRDEARNELASAGFGDGVDALSTGNGDVVWRFDPSALSNPRYVIWNIWAEYNGADERHCTVTVTLAQDDMVWICRIPAVIKAGELVILVTPASDYVFFGASL